jgi:predicted GIY-YIG superfamily endonuclease
LNEHLIPASRATGIFSYVSQRLPYELVFAEPCGKREEAQAAERMIKGWTRAKKEVLINKGWDAMEGVCSKLRKERRLKI